MCQSLHFGTEGIYSTDFGTTPCQLRFVVSVEMVCVGTKRLEFPGDFAVRQLSREQNRSRPRPAQHIGAAAPTLRTTIAGTKPVRLVLGKDPLLGSIRTADADIGPVMTWILSRVAILVSKPISIWGPAGPEVEVVLTTGHQVAVTTFEIAGPDLIARRSGQVKGDALGPRVEVETVGQTFASSRELARRRCHRGSC